MKVYFFKSIKTSRHKIKRCQQCLWDRRVGSSPLDWDQCWKKRREGTQSLSQNRVEGLQSGWERTVNHNIRIKAWTGFGTKSPRGVALWTTHHWGSLYKILNPRRLQKTEDERPSQLVSGRGSERRVSFWTWAKCPDQVEISLRTGSVKVEGVGDILPCTKS